jgi:hypothetical protein
MRKKSATITALVDSRLSMKRKIVPSSIKLIPKPSLCTVTRVGIVIPVRTSAVTKLVVGESKNKISKNQLIKIEKMS